MPFTDEADIVLIRNERYYYVILLVSFLVYVSAMFFDAISTVNGTETALKAMALGWCKFPASWANTSWLANLFLWINWLMLLYNKRGAYKVAIVSLVFCSFCLIFTEIELTDNIKQKFNLEVGYWLWLTSIVIAVIGSLALAYMEQKNKKL